MKCLFIFCVFLGLAFANIEYSTWKTVFTFPYKKGAYETPIIKIVGGQEASPHQFPYEAGLFIEYQLNDAFCGGSLISVNYVLTAAHCAQGAISIEVVLGAHNISDDSESRRQRQISTTYVVHPGWDSSALINDIALVKLSTPAVINAYVNIVKLAFGSDTYANKRGVISGWGKTRDEQTSVTDILRYATNTILLNTQCKNVDSDYNAIIQDTHLCLSGDGEISICQGDSGGPLVSNGIQVAISSFSYKTCEASKPSVFTRLTEFQDWIEDNSDVIF